MRKIGLIGGISWHTSALYYEHLNKEIAKREGGLASAPILLESLNFADIGKSETEQDWKQVEKALVLSARRLIRGGASAIFVCANSMHRVYDELTAQIDTPVVHIADAVGEKMKADGVKSAALIGPRNVMTESWYRQRLVRHGITLSPPNLERADEIDRIIYDELTLAKVRRDSERTMKTFVTNIAKQQVDAIVLGGTELGMIIDTKANILPIYDSAAIHAQAAADWILAEN